MRVPSPGPRRRLAGPFLLVCYPLCWLVVRTVGLTAVTRPTTTAVLKAFALTAGAVVVSYVAATAVVALCPDGWTPAVPSTTLLVAGGVTLTLATYVVVSSLLVLPQSVETLARLAGLVVGWPMAVVTLATYAVGNAVPATREVAGLRLVASLVGAALTAGWVLVLSDRIAAVLAGRTAA